MKTNHSSPVTKREIDNALGLSIVVYNYRMQYHIPLVDPQDIAVELDDAFANFLVLDAKITAEHYANAIKNASAFLASSNKRLLEHYKGQIAQFADIHPFLFVYSTTILKMLTCALSKTDSLVAEFRKDLPSADKFQLLLEEQQRYAVSVMEKCFDVDKQEKRKKEIFLDKFIEAVIEDENNLEAVEIPVTLYVFNDIEAGSYVYGERLRPKQLEELVDYSLLYFARKEAQFKKCKSCGRYFRLLTNHNVEYCTRQYLDTGKTCREIGASHTYIKKNKDNPIMQAYQKAYKRQFARIKYGRITKEEFDVWSEKAREMRDHALDKKISFDVYIDFLENKW